MAHHHLLAQQLAPLASQHHLSDYSRIKHGDAGSSLEYVPLCLHMPKYFAELEEKKMLLAKHKPWWPCPDPLRSSPRERTRAPVILGPAAAQPNTQLDLQDEISAAMEATFPPLLPQQPMREAEPPPPPTQVKTSATHPINISMIIPDELLPTISDQIVFLASRKPTLFEVPYQLTLDRYARRTFPTPLSHSPLSLRREVYVPNHPLSDSPLRRTVSEALQAAIHSQISRGDTLVTSSPLPSPLLPHRRIKSASFLSFSISLASSNVRPPPRQAKSLPILPDFGLIIPAPELADSIVPPSPAPPKPKLSNVINSNGKRFRDEYPGLLGNLYMSSCPGKKVRLGNANKGGRSGVCRDLDMDFTRMRNIGVRCVICCLDNNELEFLGAPWAEYSVSASNAGLDILRIPTPEGLAPLTPPLLDAHLTRIINNYTLKGLSVLVHCRGGVGRAGVVACCWMLKMGLCGWLEMDYGATGSGERPIRRDSITLVERALLVVRRQRSIKAVETYEQVKFIVDYVDYLREPEVLVTSGISET